MNKSFWKNRTVVVTGSLGFIGSHFVEELVALGAKVICLYHKQAEKLPEYKNNDGLKYVQIDLLDHKELEVFCSDASLGIDTFIHCAALDGNTQFKLDYAAEILDANNRFVSNVLKVCNKAKIHNVVLLSSAEIYSSMAPSPIAEEDDYHNYLTFTDNGYVLSKIFSEILADFYRKQYDMHIYTLRPTNVYGPRDSFKATTNRVIPAMIQKVSKGDTIEIWGDGKQTRSFIYVKDLVYTALTAVEKNTTGPLNIATKDQISILDLARHISKEYNAESLVTLDEKKPVGVKARLLDVSKMYGIIDFQPLSIKEGLKRTTAWYSQLDEEKS